MNYIFLSKQSGQVHKSSTGMNYGARAYEQNKSKHIHEERVPTHTKFSLVLPRESRYKY